MNDTRLGIYLNDHLALIVGELELAARCEASNRDSPLGTFLRHLTAEVEGQKEIVGDVLQRLGAGESYMKQGAAWFAEKLGRLKLNDSLVSYSELSRLIELEALSAAAQERMALWETLNVITEQDKRFDGIVFSYFRDQAQSHLAELGVRRRFAATEAFQ